MKVRLTRRKLIPAFGVIGGALLARAASILPERQLLAGVAPGALSAAEPRKVQARQLLGSELRAAVAGARASAAGSDTFRGLAALGFRPVPDGVAAVEANDVDGTRYGSMVLMDLVDGGGRRARFIHRRSPNPITGAAIWSKADPARIEVYESNGGGLRRSSELTVRSDRSILVESADGRRTVIPPRPLDLSPVAAGEGRAGLAAPLPDWVEVCEWICQLSWEIVCGLVFVVACTVCGVETLGLCIIACAVVGIVVCYTTAHNWCYTSCRWVWV